MGHRPDGTDQLPWAAGSRHLYHQPQSERNWGPQSAGGIGFPDRSYIIKGFYQTGSYSFCHRHPDSLVGASSMAGSVCVQDDDELVGVWAEWAWYDRGSAAHFKHSNCSCCQSQPGGEPEDGMIFPSPGSSFSSFFSPSRYKNL